MPGKWQPKSELADTNGNQNTANIDDDFTLQIVILDI